jgi:hypothetical protein
MSLRRCRPEREIDVANVGYSQVEGEAPHCSTNKPDVCGVELQAID